MSEEMRQPRVEKVVINIGVGEAGERLLKAQKVLKMLTDQEPMVTHAKGTNRDLGIREGMPIGCKVTLRGEKAEDFLRRSLWIRENLIADYSFGDDGNVSFGIPDYTDFKNMKYDPEIGIFGMDISVVIERPGYRVTKRRIRKRKLPEDHKVDREEAMEFMEEKFDVEVVE